MIFANPLFLIGLVAVAIPVVVHLFNFRRYRKVLFSNVSRLVEVKSEKRKVRQLRQLLIMIARILAVVFLVLAFARPVIPSGNNVQRPGTTAVSIYVDNSFSMENAGSEGSLLAEARRKVGEIADAYGPETQFQLMTGDMAGHEFRWLSRDELLTAADALDESPRTVMLSAAVKRQADFLASSQAANRHLYVIGDFQQDISDFEALPADSSITARFVPLDAEAADNVYIDTLVLDAPSFVRGASVTVEVTLRNTGDRDVEKLPVRLYAGGREAAMAAVDIAAGSSITVPLKFVVRDEGAIDGRVEIVDYPVTFDDRFYFSLNAAGPVKVAVINKNDKNRYLTRLFEDDSSVVCRQSSERIVDYSTLADNNFIILNELGAIGSGMAQTLHTFVRDGGSLLVIPSVEADMESYNSLLSLFSAPQLQAFERRKMKITEVDLSSRLYRNVFAGRNDEMELPTTQGRVKFALTSATVAEKVLSTADGGAYLTHTAYGDGHVYLLAAPISPEFSDFAEQALFVPTIYNMALYSRNVRQPYYLLGNEAPITLSGHYDPSSVPHLVSSDGTTDIVPDLRQLGSRTVMITHGEPTHAGNYRLRSQSGADEALAFNYDHRESELRFVPRGEISRRLKDAGLKQYSVITNPEKPLGEQIRARDGGRELWRLCLVLALAMIAVEIALIKLPFTKIKNNEPA